MLDGLDIESTRALIFLVSVGPFAIESDTVRIDDLKTAPQSQPTQLLSRK